MFNTSQLILHLSQLGFGINWKKSSLHPLQRLEYLGVVLDSRSLRTVLSESRQTDLLQTVQRLRRGAAVTALKVMRALGLMAAAYRLPFGAVVRRIACCMLADQPWTVAQFQHIFSVSCVRFAAKIHLKIICHIHIILAFHYTWCVKLQNIPQT